MAACQRLGLGCWGVTVLPIAVHRRMVSFVPIVPVHRLNGNFVRLDVFGVPTGAIPAALALMATSPLQARGTGASFIKFLGMGHGRSFTAGDADLNHWAVLTVWPSAADGDRFAESSVLSRWGRLSREHRVVRMRPVASVGSWSGQRPFVPHADLVPGGRAADEAGQTLGAGKSDGADAGGPMVASVTRARVKMSQWRAFQQSVPAVAESLANADGLLWAVGVGESPIGWQGTFSVWDSGQALRDFAYGGHAHREVIGQTKTTGWYAEELFATFVVDEVVGRYEGQELICR